MLRCVSGARRQDVRFGADDRQLSYGQKPYNWDFYGDAVGVSPLAAIDF
jgi:hypothetical protein